MKKLEDFLVTGLLTEQDSNTDAALRLAKRQKEQDEKDLQRYERVAARQQATNGEINPGVQAALDKLKKGESVTVLTPPTAGKYYSTKTGITGTPTDHALKVRQRAEERLASGETLDANDLFYLQNIGLGAAERDEKGMLRTSGSKGTPEQIRQIHGFMNPGGNVAQQSYELPSATNIMPDSDLPPSPKRISSMYWPTYEDFYKATGQKYDAMNSRHRQLLFDLNSRGESTASPLAGVGQGPAYDSLEYHTMRRRPSDIPQFGEPNAWYDTETGTTARTTEQSRQRAQQASDRADFEYGLKKQDEAIKQLASYTVNKEAQQDALNRLLGQNANFWKQVSGASNKNTQQRQNVINQLEKELDISGGRTIDDRQIPPSTPGKGRHIGDTDQQRGQFNINDPDLGPERPSSDPIATAINSGIVKVGETGKDIGQKILDMMKVQLMQPTIPSGMGRHPADSDFQRGQFPIYGEGENVTTEPQTIQDVRIGPNLPTSYVVPESEEWEKLSETEKVNMAVAAMQKGEAHKFFGGREKKTGGFLGIGGEKTGRFSEDNSGQTPEETARLNRVAKMLNNLLDKYDAGARGDQEETSRGPVVDAAAANLSGQNAVRPPSKRFNYYSQSPFGAAQVISRLAKGKQFSTKDMAPDEKAQVIPSDADAFEKAYQEWKDQNEAQKMFSPRKLMNPYAKQFNSELESGSSEEASDEQYGMSLLRSQVYNKAYDKALKLFVSAKGNRPESKADQKLFNTLLYKELLKAGFSYDEARQMFPMETTN